MQNTNTIMVKVSLRLVLTLFIANIFTNVIGATFTSITSGNWSSGNIWDQSGAIPQSGDDVVISPGHIVTCATETTVNSITILGVDNDNYGKLVINIGANLSTTGHTTVYGKLQIIDGVFNEGNSSGDKLSINGQDIGNICSFEMSGGTLNISRYISMSNQSSFNMSDGVINVNSSGGSSSSDIFYVPAGTIFNMSGGTINILNGNLGSGSALKLNPSISSFTGGTINFNNEKDYEITDFIMNVDIYNLSCDVGAGNELVIQNMAVTGGGFSCNDFTINTGSAAVAVNSGLTISGQFNNNTGIPEGFRVLSDNTGNGSVIFSGTVNGDVCVNRYLPNYTTDNDGWHIISSPVNNMSISGSDFEPGSNDDLYIWNESSSLWLNYKDPENAITVFNNGEGNMVSYESDVTGSFNGVPNYSNIEMENLSVGIGEGWHLLGNPYSSAIIWNHDNWNLINIGGVAKVWNEQAGNYDDISNDGVIPSTNGFFVQAVSSTNSLTIPAGYRVHNDDVNNYKSTKNDFLNTLIVTVACEQNGYYDRNTIGFKEEASQNWDMLFDSRKLFGNTTAPQLFTVSENEELSTNFMQLPDHEIIVPLHFMPGTNGYFTMSFDSINSFNGQISVFLSDIKNETEIDLQENAEYYFEANINDDPHRFNLKFNRVTSNTYNKESKFGTYVSHGRIYTIENYSTNEVLTSIYSISGHLVYSGTIDREGVPLQNGVYLIICHDVGKSDYNSSLIIVNN